MKTRNEARVRRHFRVRRRVRGTTGRPRLVGAAHVKPGATVIDVGVNRLPDGKLTGDVDFAAVSPLVSAITPVPGGVGPTTVAMLMRNTLGACRRQLGL